MNINRVTHADVAALSEIFDEYRQFYGKVSDPGGASAFLEDRIQRGESTAFLATDANGDVMGFVQLYPCFSSLSMGRIYILNDLFVRTRYRGRGLAQQLISAATKFAIEAGAIRISLSTARTNSAAQALYEKSGWKKDEHFLSYDFSLPA